MQEPAPALSVLALNYEFPPIGGGGATAHQALLRELIRKHACRVLLITTGLEPKVVHVQVNERLTIQRIPVGKKDLRYWRRGEVLWYFLRAYREAKRALARDRFDVCHAFFGIPCGLVAYRLKRFLPYVLSLRGSDVPGFSRRFSWDHRLLRPLVRRSWAGAAAVVANSEGLREQAERAFRGFPIHVILNGVDTSEFQPEPHTSAMPPRLITIARLIPRKGIDLLIEALSGLAARPWQLTIIGDGPEGPHLAALVERKGLVNRVQFRGDLDRQTIRQILPTCDLFILPSRAEGMSNAALEAMACGLPVVLTKTGGASELVDGNGLVVPCGEVEALRTALDRLLATPDEWAAMGAKSRRIAETLSWSAAADRYWSLLVKAAGKG